MAKPVGLRVRLVLGNPDPGMPMGFVLPEEAIEGTISARFRGEFDRPYYYVLLDKPLELDTTLRTVEVLSNAQQSMHSAGRRTRMLDMFDTSDTEQPPTDLLGPSLLGDGHGEARGVHMVFGAGVPDQVDLGESQEDARRPLSTRNRVGIGYALVEVI